MILQQNSTDVRVNYFYDEDNVIQPIDVLYERHSVNPNGLIQLKNIPSPLHTVFTIIRRNGTNVIQYNKVESVVNQYDFMVDYINGILTFHSSQVGKEIQISYTNSIGQLNISADVIFTNIDNQGNIVQTLGTMIDEGRSVLSDLSVLGGASKVITELQGYIESARELTGNIIQGSNINTELKKSTDTAKSTNTTLNSTIVNANNKISDMNNWVESHGDIINLDNRVGTAEDKLNTVSASLEQSNNKLDTTNKLKVNEIFNSTQYDFVLNAPIVITKSLDKPTFLCEETSVLTGTKYNAYNYEGSNIGVNSLFTYFENAKIGQSNAIYPYRTYVSSTAMTGANLTPCLNVEFFYDGNEFEIITSSYDVMSLWFDEGRGYERGTKSKIDITIAGKSILYIKVMFNDAKKRRFKIQSRSRFGGIIAKTGYSVTKTDTINTKSIAFVGDSITEGSGLGDKSLSFPQLVSDALGYNCINNGIGATGYIANANGTRTNFYDRLDNDIISLSPNIVVLAGGVNDSDKPLAEIKTQVQNCINKLKSTLPNVTIIILGVWSPRNPWVEIKNVNTAIKEVAILNNLPFIDTINGETFKGNGTQVTFNMGSWFTGTNINMQDGNCHLYISSDTTHPNQAGHYYISKMLAMEIYKVLN